MPTPEQLAERLWQLRARGWPQCPRFGRVELIDAIIDHRQAIQVALLEMSLRETRKPV